MTHKGLIWIKLQLSIQGRTLMESNRKNLNAERLSEAKGESKQDGPENSALALPLSDLTNLDSTSYEEIFFQNYNLKLQN